MTEVLSPITGSVWRVLVREGVPVGEGETLVILESMKMEIRVKAPRTGTLVETRVKEGDSVLEDDVIAIIR